MKSFSIAILLLAVCSIKAKTVYKCASDLKLDTCYLTEVTKVGDETTTTIYVDACSKGKFCNYGESSDLPIANQCVKFKFLLLEGEKCESPSECFSGMCNSNKCAASGEGTKCSEDYECKVGYYCKDSGDSKVCAKYAGKGESCEGDIECRPGLSCEENKCVVKYTLENGKTVDYSSSCKSGHRFNSGDGYKCGIVKTVGTCSSSSGTAEATITFDTDKTVNCQCSGNYDDSCSTYQEYKDSQSALDEYVKAFSDKIDDILDDDEYLEHYMLNEDEDTFGIKKLREKWVEYDKYSEIASASEDDKDCVRDFFIRQLSSRKLFLNIFGIALFALALL